jgi:hypothetical protein
MNVALILVAIVSFAFCMRFIPARINSARGNDAFFHLLCAEKFHADHKLPIVLPPYFLLEPQEQWYPPLFFAILGILPDSVRRSWAWIVPVVADTLTTGTVFSSIYLLTNANLHFALIATFAYAISIYPIKETMLVTPRPIGALFFLITMVSAIGLLTAKGPWILFLPMALVSGVIVLLTHKLSSQALYVCLPVMAIVLPDYRFAFILLGIFVLAITITGGFFIKIAIAHIDIVTFWYRNWSLLGAHPIYESPLYAGSRPLQFKSQCFFKQTIKDAMLPLLRLAANSPLLFGALWVIINYYCTSQSQNIVIDILSIWLISITLFALSTHWVPILRSLGQCHQYYKLIQLPIIYLALSPFWQLPTPNWVYCTYCSIAITIMAGLVVKIMWPALKKSEKPIYSIDNAMKELIVYVKAVSLRSDMRAVV